MNFSARQPREWRETEAERVDRSDPVRFFLLESSSGRSVLFSPEDEMFGSGSSRQQKKTLEEEYTQLTQIAGGSNRFASLQGENGQKFADCTVALRPDGPARHLHKIILTGSLGATVTEEKIDAVARKLNLSAAAEDLLLQRLYFLDLPAICPVTLMDVVKLFVRCLSGCKMASCGPRFGEEERNWNAQVAPAVVKVRKDEEFCPTY